MRCHNLLHFHVTQVQYNVTGQTQSIGDLYFIMMMMMIIIIIITVKRKNRGPLIALKRMVTIPRKLNMDHLRIHLTSESGKKMERN
jgi:hypothetical protein